MPVILKLVYLPDNKPFKIQVDLFFSGLIRGTTVPFAADPRYFLPFRFSFVNCVRSGSNKNIQEYVYAST